MNPFLQSKVDENPKVLDALNELVHYFGPELSARGVNVPKTEIRLAYFRSESPHFSPH